MLLTYRYCCLLLIALHINACGFHLRGGGEQFSGAVLPKQLSETHIQTVNKTGDLFRFVQRGLTKAGIRIVDETGRGTAILTLNESITKQPLSYDTAGRAVEYEVFYTVRFSARQSAEDWSMPEQTITLNRGYYFDPLDALAADRQEQRLLADMRREAARLVLDRLRALGHTE